MNFDSWKYQYGYDKVGSVVADPLFVSPGRDFRLQSGSPAVKAGVSVGLLEDYADVPVSGKPDIGACEFQRGWENSRDKKIVR